MGTNKVDNIGGGGFLQLFSWNRKSRKKLFASISPEGSKQLSRSDDDSTTVQNFHVNGDDENGGFVSSKESRDFCCISSVTGKDGIATKAPGVVARLMGLDAFPNTNVTETGSTPLVETRSSHDSQCQNRSLGFDVDNPLTLGLIKTEAYSSKLPEMRSQKMPSSPIEKFQIEMLPPRLVKSLPSTYYRLLSPVKNPRFMSSQEMVDIMKASAKILDPKFQSASSKKASSIRSATPSLKARDSKELVKLSQKASSLPESSRKFTKSNTTKKLGGQQEKKYNAADNSNSSIPSSNLYGSKSMEMKDKGKCNSLATRAKVNVLQKGNMCSFSRISEVPKEPSDFKVSHLNVQKNKQQNRVTMSNSSGVLKQNSHKENCSISKHKVPAKALVRNQLATKCSSAVASSRKKKSLNKLQVNSKNANGKGLRTTHTEEQPLYWNCHSESTESATNILVGRIEKHLQPSIFYDEQTKWDNGSRKNATDVVSFTFNSPLGKSIPGSQLSKKMKDKQISDGESNRRAYAMNVEDAKKKPKASNGLCPISGDELSILLEQKLSELTMELESDHFSHNDTFHVSSPSSSMLHHPLHKSSTKEASKLDFSLINDQVCNFGQQLQESKGTVCTRNNAFMPVDLQQRSLFSVPAAPFSIEKSPVHNTSGVQLCSCVEVQKNARTVDRETDIDLSDSASLSFSEPVDVEQHGGIELEYVRDILSAADFNSVSCCSFVCGFLDPVVFQQLENKTSRFRSTDVNGRVKRKMLFDCVGECLDLKRSCYFSTGYKSWVKGVEVVGKSSGLAEEIYKEVAGWREMENWTVDELINKDMSCSFGRWIDFERDVYATGVEIQDQILGLLLDEIVDVLARVNVQLY